MKLLLLSLIFGLFGFGALVFASGKYLSDGQTIVGIIILFGVLYVFWFRLFRSHPEIKPGYLPSENGLEEN